MVQHLESGRERPKGLPFGASRGSVFSSPGKPNRKDRGRDLKRTGIITNIRGERETGEQVTRDKNGQHTPREEIAQK